MNLRLACPPPPPLNHPLLSKTRNWTMDARLANRLASNAAQTTQGKGRPTLLGGPKPPSLLPQVVPPDDIFLAASNIVEALDMQKSLKRGRWFSKDEELVLYKCAGDLREQVLKKGMGQNWAMGSMDLANPAHLAEEIREIRGGEEGRG
jgi:hypothetical protein